MRLAGYEQLEVHHMARQSLKVSNAKLHVTHSNLVEPEDFFSFVELPSFSEARQRLSLARLDLKLIQTQIMLNPVSNSHVGVKLFETEIMVEPVPNPVEPGVPGARRMRYARKREKDTIELEVLYAAIAEVQMCVLIAVGPRPLRVAVTADEKRILREIIADVQQLATKSQIQP
jgi:hypothetical protein